MYKVIWMCRFAPGLDPAQARRHWREVHGPLALQVPGLIGYVQSHRTGEVAGLTGAADPRSFDGYSAGWFESREAYDKAMASPQWADLAADGASIFDPDSMLVAGFEEHVMRPVPRPV